jgi:hypothetical protein
MHPINGWFHDILHLAGRIGFTCLVLTPFAASCASTGATFQSGVGDRFLEHPPYYAGSSLTAAGQARTGHMPIVYQKGASQPAIFDPDMTPAMAALLTEMNRYVDSLGITVRLVAGSEVSTRSQEKTGVPPDVHFGCATASGAPGDECAEREGALGRGNQTMWLAVGRPSSEWIHWNSQMMDQAAVERSLVITLRVGQYLIRQRGLVGSKEVELGTSYVEKLPWLTSLETPVSVLQLTGALVGRDGKAIRIGAEGMLARRTSLPISALGAQALITDEEVERLRTVRRQDLPGNPLVWQVSLRTLVTQLASVGVAEDGSSRTR